MKLSRRQLAQSLAAGAIAGTAVLQGQPPAATQELDLARVFLRATSESVRRVNLPMSVEPATLFKAKV